MVMSAITTSTNLDTSLIPLTSFTRSGVSFAGTTRLPAFRATDTTNSPARLARTGRILTSHVHDGIVSMPSAVNVETIAGTNIAGYNCDHDGEKCRNAAVGPSIRNGYVGTATHQARKMMFTTISAIRLLDFGGRLADLRRGSVRGDHFSNRCSFACQ